MSKLCLGLATTFFLAAISFTGCCGPMMVGPGCADLSCNDCSGCSASTQYIANGPLDALRNARRRMVCGSGCGETYVGEWISTPPDSQDPCCDSQFVGGATKCRPFCWQPGNLFRGLYGQRFCSGDQSSAPCGCGDTLCDGGCGSYVTNEIVSGSMIAAPATSSCGCSASAHPVQTQTQIVMNKPPVDMATSVRKQVVTRKTNVAQRPRAQASRASNQRVIR